MEDMPIDVLLVEDNPVDVRFTHEAFRAIHPSIHFHVVSDGVEAMAFLRHEGAHHLAPRPSLIIPHATAPAFVTPVAPPGDLNEPPTPTQAPEPSLGDTARKARQHKACLELAKDNPSIACD